MTKPEVRQRMIEIAVRVAKSSDEISSLSDKLLEIVVRMAELSDELSNLYDGLEMLKEDLAQR